MDKRKYWLQLPQNYFDRLVQRKMRKQPEGINMQVVYLKLLLAGLRTDGLILFQDVYESIDEEIAEAIDEDLTIVQKTIKYCIENHLAREIQDEEGGGFFLSESDELTGSESESAERVRQHRKRLKALHCNGDVTESDAVVTKINGSVTDGNDIRVKVNKRKEYKRTEDTFCNSFSLIDKEGAGTSARPANAGAASGPSLMDCEIIARNNNVAITPGGLSEFHRINTDHGWTINGEAINILRSMRGFIKAHPEYSTKKPKPRPVEREAPSRVSDRRETEPAELPEKPKKKELTADDISLEELFGEECKGL